MNPLALDLEHILNHTQPYWDELRGERLFLTGGTGFFGCWLLESFLWANTRLNLNSRITVLTRDPQAFISKAPHLALNNAVTLVEGDVRDFAYPDGVFPFVIHAATESSAKLNAENPILMLDTITAGTRHTLDFALAHGTQKFLLTSSGAVYGKQPPELPNIPEDYPGAPNPLDPKSSYGQGKRLAEHLCALYGQNSHIQIKIARCFAFVGPYLPLDAHFAIGNFIRDGLKGGPIFVQGDGTPLRSYLYAADLTIWLWTILFNGQHLRPYNVGSKIALSIEELARLVAGQFSSKPPVKILIPPNPQKLRESYVPSIQRATTGLGLKQLIPLPLGIQKTINYKGA